MRSMWRTLALLVGIWLALVTHELWWIVAEWGS
jgi:hypothetical protein